jgi:uncharacterized protein YndB with AHSA1/START domain
MSSTNLSAGAARPQGVIVIERTYRARIEDLWALWTTKAGFESVVGAGRLPCEGPRPGSALRRRVGV